LQYHYDAIDLCSGCGGKNPEEFNGLIMLDKCHKAKTIQLDKDGKPVKVSKGTSWLRLAIVHLHVLHTILSTRDAADPHPTS